MAKRTIGESPQREGGGSTDVLRLGEKTRIRLLEPAAEEWLQHGVEGEDDKGMEVYRSVVCLGSPECPLCAKGRKHFPITKRMAINVLDSEDEVKILMGGTAIFDKGFGKDARAGFNILDFDYLIQKDGTGRSTSYDVVRMERSTRRDVQLDELHDLSRYSDPMTVEAIFMLLDDLGIDYDSLTLPEYTREEAAAMPTPFGKYSERKMGKGMGLTLGQLIVEDRGWAEWLVADKEGRGDTFDDVYLALKVLLAATPAPTKAQKAAARPAPAPVATPAQAREQKQAEAAKAEGFREVEDPDAQDIAEMEEPAVAPVEPMPSGVAQATEALECPVCGFKSRTKSGYTLHMKGKHPDYDASAAPAPKPTVVKEDPTANQTSEHEDAADEEIAVGAPTSRTELMEACRDIFMKDHDRFDDFSKMGEYISKASKGRSHVLKDLTDAELGNLYGLLSM